MLVCVRVRAKCLVCDSVIVSVIVSVGASVSVCSVRGSVGVVRVLGVR